MHTEKMLQAGRIIRMENKCKGSKWFGPFMSVVWMLICTCGEVTHMCIESHEIDAHVSP